MKAPAFDYVRPDTLAEALAFLADDTVDTVPLAGGQSLMPMMNFRMAMPDRLVDLNGVPGLTGVEDLGDALRIGAMTRYADLVRAPAIAAHVPLMARALPHIAHAAIRNRGTIGGSVALADPAAEMPAVLLALDAVVTMTGADGTRDIAADDFFLGLYETALEESELVTSITVPKARPGDRFGFYELARRHGDYAISGVAVAGRGAPEVTGCRIAFFSVSDRALRARAAEAQLTGTDPATLTDPDLSDIDFTGDLNGDAATKAHLSRVVLTRALKEF